jgi:hypothetical protein
VIDPLGLLLVEIRDGLDDVPVRGGEPAQGDAKGPGAYQRFVVLSRLATARERRAPAQEVRIAVRCYGATYQDAAALHGEVSDLVHAKGPRLASSGIGVYASFDDAGQGATKDPDTGQPVEEFVLRVIAPTQKVVLP